jgi:hypothetical protein
LLQTISDKLFMGSLILLMVGVVVSGIGFQFMNWRINESGEPSDEPRKKRAMDRQDKSLVRLYRSKLVWIAIAGMLISIVLSLIAPA